VEVDVRALRRNYRRLQERVGDGVGILPMLKADGYGLGATRVAAALAEMDPWALGVATVDEGAELRAAGHEERIVVFSPCAPLDRAALTRHRLEPAVSSLRALRTLADLPSGEGALPIHLEVDTGIGRLGLVAGEREQWIPEVRRILAGGPVEVASTFTHFHSAGSDGDATRRQAREFRSVVEAMREAGLDPGRVHLANSAAALGHPELWADLVRPGLYLYGGLGGETVARVRARVLDVREVPAGHPVSYGATYRTPGPARLATLGIGYGDGLRRELSNRNRGHALVKGQRAPIRGAVCMDVTVVDVTDIPGAEPGGVGTLLGRDGGAEIGLGEMADACGAIPYELLTGLGSRLPRVDARRAGDSPPGEDAA